jgi:polysaccharide export outer membrane protein
MKFKPLSDRLGHHCNASIGALWARLVPHITSTRSSMKVLAVCGVLLLCISGRAFAQAPARPAPAPAPAPAVATPAAPVTTAPAPAMATPAPNVTPNYLVGPGDTVQVFVWRNPELTSTVPVRPDGKISTPLVEDLVAVGKTPSQLARDIEAVLAEFIRSPQVNVIVTNPVSAYSQVKVIGQVANPQSLAYREGMRVLDALLATGGLNTFAAGNRAKIVRKVDGKDVTLKVKVANLVNKGDMSQNLELKPGDVLIVPESVL